MVIKKYLLHFPLLSLAVSKSYGSMLWASKLQSQNSISFSFFIKRTYLFFVKYTIKKTQSTNNLATYFFFGSRGNSVTFQLPSSFDSPDCLLYNKINPYSPSHIHNSLRPFLQPHRNKLPSTPSSPCINLSLQLSFIENHLSPAPFLHRSSTTLPPYIITNNNFPSYNFEFTSTKTQLHPPSANLAYLRINFQETTTHILFLCSEFQN